MALLFLGFLPLSYLSVYQLIYPKIKPSDADIYAYNKLFKRLPWQRNLEKKDINHNHLPDVLIVELSDI